MAQTLRLKPRGSLPVSAACLILMPMPIPVNLVSRLAIKITRAYGREVVSLLLDYAFRLRNFHKVWLRMHGSNERALRAYCACGFVEEGRLHSHVWSSGSYDDLVYMGVLHKEWPPNP